MPKAYDCDDINGNQIIINTASSDEFQRRLTAPDSSDQQREEAALAIGWLSDCVARTSGMSPLDQAANRMVYELELSGVLDGLSRIVVTEKNGITRRTIEPTE